MSAEQLVKIILHQQTVIEQLQQEIERLKSQQGTDSQTSSKPPSTDLLKKSEQPKDKSGTREEGKRKPGGQPGHPGKTRKGFGRVDRYELLRPEQCPYCRSQEFQLQPVAVHDQQIADQCPFARDVKLCGRSLFHIPPLCKLNPLYEQLVGLRFRALCYLAGECSQEATPFTLPGVMKEE